jgi:enoyl-CoA hydratase/carnithine racemase
MTENSIQYTRKEHIGYITFNPNSEQGISQDLVEICAGINGDEDIYAVVINANGDFFSKASEIKPSVEDNMPSLSPAAAIGTINRPTMAALNGDVVGPGLEIALACDLRIAVETAKFGLPQITGGQIPSDGGTQRLARLVGKGKALEMILTGELIQAAEALEIGLVNKVVKAENLKLETETLAGTLVTKAPLAMRYCKEAVNKGLDMTLEQGLRLEADLYFLLHTTSDRTEGVQSYLQKRKAEYKGK